LTSRDDWLKWRRQGIGSSDIPPLLGLSKYRTPLQVYMEKRGELPDDEETWDGARLGLMMEPVARSILARERPDVKVVEGQVALSRAQHPWQRATVDFLAEVSGLGGGEGGGRLVIEVKTSNELWSDLPTWVAVQVQWQLHVARCPRALVVQIVTGRGWRIFDVERDDDTIEVLLLAASEMWERIENGEPPKASPLDSKPLSRVPVVEGATAEVAPEMVARVALARHDAKLAKVVLDEAEAELKAALGDAEWGMVEGEPIVSFKQIDRDGYTVKPTSYRRLELLGGKR
jgi:putative phage-type endonuclease